MNVCAVITAGGSGKRLPGKVKKQFLLLGDKPILFHTIERFLTNKMIDQIIVSLPEDDFNYLQNFVLSSFPEKVKCVKGGKERQDSVYRALLACPAECKIVLIHDGVRPFFGKDIINDLIKNVRKNTGVIPVSQVKSTIKECNDNKVKRTIPRSNLYKVHTPQCFCYPDILELHRRASKNERNYTDDASLMEENGLSVITIPESDYNIKITTEDDLAFANFLLKENFRK